MTTRRRPRGRRLEAGRPHRGRGPVEADVTEDEDQPPSRRRRSDEATRRRRAARDRRPRWTRSRGQVDRWPSSRRQTTPAKSRPTTNRGSMPDGSEGQPVRLPARRHHRLEVPVVQRPGVHRLPHRGLEDPRLHHAELPHAAISRIEVERTRDRLRVDVHTACPGIVIGRAGAEADRCAPVSRRSPATTRCSSTSRRSSSPSSTPPSSPRAWPTSWPAASPSAGP